MTQTNPENTEEPEKKAEPTEETQTATVEEEAKAEEKQPEPEKEEKEEETKAETPPPAPAPEPAPAPSPPPAVPEKPKRHWGRIIALVVIAAIIIIAAVGVLTFSFVPTGAAQSTSYSHMNTYDILVPNAQPVDILGSKFTFTQLGDGVVIAIDGKGGQELANGESRDLVGGHGVVRMYGKNVIETDYCINLTYKGILNGQHNFLLTIKSTVNIPQFIVPFLLPKDVTVL